MSKYEKGLTSGRQLLIVAIFVGAGYLVGMMSRDTTVHAEVRRSPTEHRHFQSGAQRSEVLLQQISTTLKKMDSRLDRIEKLAAQFATRNGRTATGEGR